jgi:hypothetical protein
MNTINRFFRAILLLGSGLIFVACGGGGGGGGSNPSQPYEPTLYQAVYVGGSYRYTKQIYITGAPADTDWSRGGMSHDGTDYRLYFMKGSTDDIVYQFGYNPNSGDFEYGYRSIRILRLTNIPADADTDSFAMSNVGNSSSGSYYAHMRSLSNPAMIYTFRFNGVNSYAYERSYTITGAPADVDWSRWAMMYGQSASRFYAGKTGDDSTIYQFKYNPTTQSYQWGYNGSIPALSVVNMPAESDTYDFAMLHNGSQYHFYYLNKQ